jgi:CheY-like chemotaxis protein
VRILRKRRAIIYDDDLILLSMLKRFFEMRGYEVISYQEPVLCPVYNDAARCDHRAPCADIMLTDYRMPVMTGVDLLRAQETRGCTILARNKAVISGFLNDEAHAQVRSLGYEFFDKPLELESIGMWLDECEDRMDLSASIPVIRKEMREASRFNLSYRAEIDGEMCTAEVINSSRSGLCIKVNKPPLERQIVNIPSELPFASMRGMVRWTRKIGDGDYLVGMSCC